MLKLYFGKVRKSFLAYFCFFLLLLLFKKIKTLEKIHGVAPSHAEYFPAFEGSCLITNICLVLIEQTYLGLAPKEFENYNNDITM